MCASRVCVAGRHRPRCVLAECVWRAGIGLGVCDATDW